MKNKIVRKLLVLGLSSTVALSSTVGVSAATVTDTTAEQAKEAEETKKDVDSEKKETKKEETKEEAKENTEKTAKGMKTVYVAFLLENGTKVGGTQIEIPEDAGNFNASILNLPDGYELASVGDVAVNGNIASVTLRKKAETKTITVNYVNEKNESVFTGSHVVKKDATYINTNELKNVPYGYELVNVGDIALNEDRNSVNIVVREKKYQKDIMVNYVLEDGSNVGTGSVKIHKDYNYVNTTWLTDVPYGYELVNVGDITLNKDENSVNIVVREKESQKDVMVNYVLEDGSNVGTGSVKIHKDYNYVNTTWLTDVPYGYELVNVGDITLNEDGNSVNIVVREKEYQKDVMVNYVLEDGSNVGTGSVKIHKDYNYVNTTWLTDVPYGYELANVGDITLNEDGNSVNIVVREKKYQKDIMVNYVLEDGSNVGTGSVKIHKDYNYVNTTWLTDVPYGYELANVGDITLNEDGNSVNIVVREKKYQKDVIVNYVNEEGNLVLTSSIKLDKDATYFNTSILKDVPYGWELVNVGDIPVNKDNTATVVVREKEYQKDIIINYVDEKGNPVLTSSLKVSKDNTYINTSWLKDVPYGWELANVGDLPIENNAVTVVVREKEYQKDVIINYVDEKGNLVLTSSIKLNKDATYFNTSILKDVPYGWELANVGDIPVNEDNTATVVVRQKKYTKDISVEYVTEGGAKVATGSLTVAEESTYINTSWLQDVPEGYEIAIVGDLPIEDGKVKVVVRGIENPDPENPDPENPDPENPDPENPDPENPDPENPDPENPNPENPDPEKPSKPEDTNKPTEGKPVDTDKKEEAKKENKKAAKTGDETNAAPLFAGLFGSGVIGLGMLQFLKRKKEDK